MERASFRSQLKSALVAVTFGALALQVHMSQRILTPNGDGINDRVLFNVESSPADPDPVEASVINVQGRRILGLVSGPPGSLAWDGKDSQGRIVPSGIYVVQITQGPARWNGVVAVAK